MIFPSTNYMDYCINGSLHEFPLYELLPGQSGDDLALWPVQNYYLHYCTFSRLYLVSMGTYFMNNCIEDSIK